MKQYSPLKIIARSMILITTAVVLSPAGVAQDRRQGTTGAESRDGCDQDNAGLTLPAGFCASVFADNLGHARHLEPNLAGWDRGDACRGTALADLRGHRDALTVRAAPAGLSAFTIWNSPAFII